MFDSYDVEAEAFHSTSANFFGVFFFSTIAQAVHSIDPITAIIMRLTPRLLAKPTSAGTTRGLKPAPLALLPPIPLYRRLLRAHRHFLPKEMRLLGDEYVKSEFRAHKDVENPVHIIGFLTEWQLYAQKLEGDAWKGETMDKSKIDKMSDQQLGQLYELMQTIRNQELQENDPEYEGTGQK